MAANDPVHANEINLLREKYVYKGLYDTFIS
jgi:hypothetical protein